MNNQFEELLALELDRVREMLISKNKKYGNSALEPVKIFSSSDSLEQINVRIDDKLNRLHNLRNGGDTEDTELDLIGYLFLRRIAKQWKKTSNE